jgi:murein DD-endopeptidase MepM/ murein hydrolase activator NlpD
MRFDLPIRCTIGTDCFVQNYFVHESRPKRTDYRCGFLTYSGHYGTDIRLRDLKAMNGRVAVVAAAPGTVAAVRDSEPDMNVKKRGKEALKGKDAGNGVRISHEDGWETQYSHLMRGSIVVRPGQRVDRGDLLGYVGLSGNTEFPHVHFTVRKAGRQVDPFAPGATACGTEAESLWTEAAAAALTYIPTGILIAGFSDRLPSRDRIEAGELGATSFPATTDNLVFWIELFGVQKDDQLSVELYGPDGTLFLQHRRTIPNNRAVHLESAGKKRLTARWQPGRYRALFRLERKGAVLFREERDAVIY